MNPFSVQDPVKSLDELCCNLLLLFSFDAKLDHSTPGVEGFDDFILVVASEDESTVSGELLNTRSKKELYIGSGIVCFIDDDDFMLCLRRERDCRREVLGVIPNSVKKPAFIRSVIDLRIYTQLLTKCFCYRSLSTSSRTRKK